MDNDYLTSLLVKLLTNLLNNHCPWLYVCAASSMTFLFIYDKSLDIFALLREAFSIIGTFLGKKWGE